MMTKYYIITSNISNKKSELFLLLESLTTDCRLSDLSESVSVPADSSMSLSLSQYSELTSISFISETDH